MIICSQVVSSGNGMAISFLYQSAKDVLKWHNLSAKEYIKTVMRIGDYVGMDDKSFEKVLNSEEFMSVSLEDLKKAYKNGSNKN